MASVKCPFCREECGCRHLIGEGDDQIIWQWDVINTLRSLCEDADLMKIDIGKLANPPATPADVDRRNRHPGRDRPRERMRRLKRERRESTYN